MKSFEPRYFQWLDGENEGTVERLNNITCVDGEYFYNFDSGEACNLRFISEQTSSPAALKGKVMVEIANPQDKWRIDTISMKKYTYMDPTAGETTVDVPPLEDITGASGQGNSIDVSESKLGQKKYIAPLYKGAMRPLPAYSDYCGDNDDYQPAPVVEQPSTEQRNIKLPEYTPEPVQQATPKIATISDADPIRILAKTCKKHPTEINLTLTINLPSRSIYNIANSEFDDGGKNFVDCLVEEIDMQEIVKSISSALQASYAEAEL